MSARKRKRLNDDDRSNILSYLLLGYTIPEIAEEMHWAPSTIYREVSRNLQKKLKHRKRKWSLLSKKYYVCNQCPKHSTCQFGKIYYNLKMAIDDAHWKKHASHMGPRATKEQIKLVDKRISVFFTNPYKATDKPHCERNHEYFRYVCPKGHSFDSWTQEEINAIFSNINSYARNELNWKRPYDLFIEPFTKEAAKALGISEIAANDVNLSSKF